MNPHPVIDYESAVTAYMENLYTTLRGFSPAGDMVFLETWVPDENPLQSILGIFEAAKEAGIPGVTVRVGAQTLPELDLATIENASAAWGQPDFRTAGGTSVLTLSFAGPDPLRDVNLLYRASLEAAAGAREFEGVLELEAGAILAVASHAGLKLMALVVPERHIVAKARHYGASNEIERRLLTRLCPILEGKPIMECSDHGVIELEFSLRDHSLPAPVPGVIMPENCDPMFALPVRLVRDLLADYRRKAAFTATENFYLRPTSPRWRRLSREQRQTEVAAALESFPRSTKFHLATIEGDRRVVVQIESDMAKGTKGSCLLQLERHLQQTVESVLQVHLQAKPDLNTIRHIKEVAV
jgi:hypothetical protein